MDMVYPSAVYSRFEHSLGVMHLATLMYDSLILKEENVSILKSKLSYNDSGLKRDKQLVRIAALLHDVGHTPLSHSGEEFMPENKTTGKKYGHEDYTAKIIRENLREVIENHRENRTNYNISAEEVASLIEGNEKVLGEKIFWKSLISSQLDADRGDYLLRDSHHIGVKYGIYDKDRLINTIKLAIEPEEEKPILAVDYGGWHVAEELILARYLIFAQVYFHKTRRAYDYHLGRVFESLLPNGMFPEAVDDFLEWDDWKIFQLIKANAKEKRN
ncbi:MAG: HD domain-containing protein [Methanophagales archaeon ANME-1-THS]|nr:MAG: HD domain-containing protein [Methanophagales archaeon ANME-1-THS]